MRLEYEAVLIMQCSSSLASPFGQLNFNYSVTLKLLCYIAKRYFMYTECRRGLGGTIGALIMCYSNENNSYCTYLQVLVVPENDLNKKVARIPGSCNISQEIRLLRYTRVTIYSRKLTVRKLSHGGIPIQV